MKGRDRTRTFRNTRHYAVQGIFLLLLLWLAAGCQPRKGRLPGSSGKMLEILVVVDRPDGTKTLPAAFREVIQAPQPALNQPEPGYDLLIIRPKDLTGFFNTHHNILNIRIHPTVKREGLVVRRDVWAVPQVIADLNARSDSSAALLIRQKASQVLNLFRENEILKVSAQYAGTADPAVSATLAENMRIRSGLPECFYVAVSGKDYCWLRCRDEEKETGWVLSRIPYRDTALFDSANMAGVCDSLVSALIPGSRPGSHMVLSRGLPILIRQSDLQGQFAMELRGLWETRNDQMGGPFLAYLMPYPSRKEVLIQYGYVYHPNAPKRDLLFQMETIMRTVQFTSQQKN